MNYSPLKWNDFSSISIFLRYNLLQQPEQAPLIRGGKLNATPMMIECTFTEAHFLPSRENEGNYTVAQHHQHCHDTDSDLVYQLEGINDEHVRALSLQSGHTKLKIPYHFKKDEDNLAVKIEDPSAVIVSNDHQDRRELTRTGQYKVLVVLVTDRFGNRPSQSEAQMANDVFQDRVNLRERYRACSKNKLDFVPATGPRVNNGIITVQTSSSLRGISYTDCGNLASRALPSGISRNYIMFVCPDNTNFNGGAAWGQVGGSLSWYPSQYASAADVQVHELGHNLGYGHSGTDLRDNTYDDGTCHMSNEGGFTDESRKFCFNAAKYHYSNWFPEFYTTVTPTSANFKGDLVGIDDVVNNRANSANQELVVKIQGSGQSDLFMMFNRKKGINSDVPEHGDQVVIIAQSSRSAISVRLGALSTGQTGTISNWANSGNALKIKVCSVDNGGDVASVIIYLENVNNVSCGGGPAPTPTPPSGACDCSSCTSSVLSRNAGGHRVRDRISWLQGNRGMSEIQACKTVCSTEFPNICGECNPDRCGGGPAPTPPAPTPTPPTGGGFSRKFMLINPQTGKALDVNGAKCDAGTNIHLWDVNRSGAQIFHYHYDSKAIVNVMCNKAIDISAFNCNDGANIQLWSRNRSGAQQFSFYTDRTIRSVGCQNKAIDIDKGSSDNGTNILSWSIHGGTNQKWKVEYV